MLLTTPNGNNIFIVMNMLGSRRFQRLLKEVLREQYKPNFLQFVPSLTLPMYLTGCFSGIVMDCGFSQTEVMAIVEGVPLKRTLDYAPVGGLLALMKTLQLYKQSPIISNTLLEGFEKDLDSLTEVAVKTFYIAQLLQSTGRQDCLAASRRCWRGS
jgi:actin-related protein